MQYVTLSSLVSLGSLTYDSTTSANIILALNAVNAYIDNYIGYSLDEAIIGETLDIIDNSIIPSRNIQKIYSVNEGCTSCITIDTTNDEIAVEIGELSSSIILGVTSYDLGVTDSMTIGSFSTAIQNSILSASVTCIVNEGTGVNMKAIYAGNYQSYGDVVEIPYAPNKIKYNYRGNSKIIMTPDVECSTSRVIYKTGYSEVPADIAFAATKFALLIYNNRSAIGTTTSETIGDYSYTISNLSSTTSDDTIIQINNILDNYRQIDI